MVASDDDDRNLDIVLATDLFRHDAALALFLRIAPTDDAFVIGPMLIRHQRVVQHDQPNALVEQRQEPFFLLIADRLRHVVEHHDIVVEQVGALVNRGVDPVVFGVRERNCPVVFEHLEERFAGKTVPTSHDEHFQSAIAFSRPGSHGAKQSAQ
jgi:hypothetical protein